MWCVHHRRTVNADSELFSKATAQGHSSLHVTENRHRHGTRRFFSLSEVPKKSRCVSLALFSLSIFSFITRVVLRARATPSSEASTAIPRTQNASCVIILDQNDWYKLIPLSKKAPIRGRGSISSQSSTKVPEALKLLPGVTSTSFGSLMSSYLVP